MLREVKRMHSLTLHALDGEIGCVDEILFDDEHWTVRYLIVKTGNWLFGRKVMISPMAFGGWDWEHHILHINLTRQQIEKSPGVETDKPASPPWEIGYYDYYAMPYYWVGRGGWGPFSYPGALLAQPTGGTKASQLAAEVQAWDHSEAHLRSTKELNGYELFATDGPLGQVQDFIVNDETWRISYFAVDTKDWLPEKAILLPPTVIGEVDWSHMRVTVNLTRDQVRNAPDWIRDKPISRSVEDELYGYFARQHPQHPAAITPPKTTLAGQAHEEPLSGAVSQVTDKVVAVYETHGEAETAIRELQHRGVDMTKLSIVGKDYQTREEFIGYYNTGDRMKSWGATGAFWGGIWSLLFGSAFFIVPGIGPILAAGPIVAWIVGVVESAAVVGGISALGAALVSIGIPNNSIIEYETQIRAGKFVVIARDVPGRLENVRIALEATNPLGVKPYFNAP